MDNSKIGHHISEQFNKELEDIRNKVLMMGGLVERQIEQAIEAYTTGNMELAEQVIKQDNDVDLLEVAIDQECTQILALRQPTAFDLRLLITVIKIIHEIERVGDKAERIAEMAIKLANAEIKMSHHELEHMAQLVKGMMHDALDSFARMTLDEVPAITALDVNVDREYDSILRQLITRMMEDPRNITRTLDVLWTVRALERIGDHACYICEHLVYMIKGEDVRHLSQEELEKRVRIPR
ncbi:MAG: phosphate transport system regulatory protein PhoU [Methylococcales bacterium]|nr:MAG: phosphate transport system regulatory protein PhoU [Methylococcales bacterium]